MPVTIWHNPRCATSRRVLEMIRDKGIEPHVVEYLKTPPSAKEIKAVLAKLRLDSSARVAFLVDKDGQQMIVGIEGSSVKNQKIN